MTLRFPDVQSLAATSGGQLLVAAPDGVSRLDADGARTQLDAVSALQAFEVPGGLLVLPGGLEPGSSWKRNTDWPELRRDGERVHRFAPQVPKRPGSQHRWVSQVLADAAGKHALVSWCWGFTGQVRRVVSLFALATGKHVRTVEWEPPARADLGEGASWSKAGAALVWHGGLLHEVPLKGAVKSRPAPLVHERFLEGYGGPDTLLHTERRDGWHLLFARPASQARQLPAFLCDEAGRVVTLEPCDAAGFSPTGEPYCVRGQQLELLAADGAVARTIARSTKTKVVAAASVGASWFAATAKAIERVEFAASGARAQETKRARERQPATGAGGDPRPALWKKPGDAAALAVCADWFEEQGAASRAEFIRLSLGARSPAEEKRRLALLRKHRGDWLGDARKYLREWKESEASFGFLEWARCTPANLLAGVAHFRWLGPRLTLELTGPRNLAEAGAVGALDLSWLHGLAIAEGSTRSLSTAALKALAPAFAPLRELELAFGDGDSTLEADSLHAVLQHATKAERVTLKTRNRQALSGLARVARPPALKVLRCRNLSGVTPFWPDVEREWL